MSSSKTCVALLIEGTEELELVGTVDILRRAGVNEIWYFFGALYFSLHAHTTFFFITHFC